LHYFRPLLRFGFFGLFLGSRLKLWSAGVLSGGSNIGSMSLPPIAVAIIRAKLNAFFGFIFCVVYSVALLVFGYRCYEGLFSLYNKPSEI
jgi:hypothetical protein